MRCQLTLRLRSEFEGYKDAKTQRCKDAKIIKTKIFFRIAILMHCCLIPKTRIFVSLCLCVAFRVQKDTKMQGCKDVKMQRCKIFVLSTSLGYKATKLLFCHHHPIKQTKISEPVSRKKWVACVIVRSRPVLWFQATVGNTYRCCLKSQDQTSSNCIFCD